MTSDGSGCRTALQALSLDYSLKRPTISEHTQQTVLAQPIGAEISFATITDVTFSTTSDGSLLLHSVANKKIIYTCNGSNCYIKYSSNNGNSYNAGVLITMIIP